MKRKDEFDEFGGKKNKAFVTKMKVERQTREQLKKEQFSASKIQSFFRFRKILNTIYQAWEEEFKKKAWNVINLQKALKSEQFSLLVNKVLLVTNKLPLRNLLVCINKKNYSRFLRALGDVLKLILPALSLQNAEENVVAGIYSRERRFPITFIVQKIVAISAWTLIQAGKETKSPHITEELMKNCIAFLEQIANFNSKNYKFLGMSPETKAQNKQVGNSLFARVHYDEVFTLFSLNPELFLEGPRKKIALRVLGNLPKEVDKFVFLGKMMRLKGSMMQLSSGKIKKMREYLTIVTSASDLANFEVKNASLSEQKFFIKNLNALFTKCFEKREKGQFSLQRENLKNFFQILRKMLTTFSDNLLKQIASEKANTKMQIENEDEEEEEEEKMDSKKKKKKQRSCGYSIISKYNSDEYCKEINDLDLGLYTSPVFLAQLAEEIKLDLKNNKSLPNFKKMELISGVSEFVVDLIKIRKSEKVTLLNIFSMSYDFLETLYKVFELLDFKLDQIMSEVKISCGILNLFCKLFYQRISVMDTHEFYEEEFLLMVSEENSQNWGKRNFSIRDLNILGELLNHFSVRYYTSFFGNTSHSLKLKKTVKSVNMVLRELYNRDTRKKFTFKKDFWVVCDEPKLKTCSLNKRKECDWLDEMFREIPHAFEFPKRLERLRFQIEEDMKNQDRSMQWHIGDGFHEKIFSIRRNYEFEEGFAKLNSIDMKAHFVIKFIDEYGNEENGIDGGGIFKEFITQVCRSGFSPDLGLFKEAEDNSLVPNVEAKNIHENYEQYFEFLGKIVGKAIYENILIEPVLSLVFLNIILKKKNSIEELSVIDQDLYKSLMKLKKEKNLAQELGLTFEIDEKIGQDVYPIELKKNGRFCEVTEENKLDYITLYAEYKLDKQTEHESKCFLKGFSSVIDLDWLKMFNNEELQFLISGKSGFDTRDLRENCVLNGFKEGDLTVEHLWSVLEEFSNEEKSLFLRFCTSCSRPPTLGFRFLSPRFSIQRAMAIQYGENNIERLPTSATCMNILKLPDYRDREKLKAKLLYAIKAKAGFDLS